LSFWYAIALGVLQGLTEFLPVSSSGHLALAQLLIPGFEQPGVFFDASLHLGTALAVVWLERRQILGWLRRHGERRSLGLIVVGLVATAAVAFPLRSLAVSSFERPIMVGVFLVITAVIVYSTRFLPGGPFRERTSRWGQAIFVGLAQGAAVFPGISRSGLTIAAGLSCGFDRVWAARFSFLLSVPAILGVTVLETIGEFDALVGLGSSFWCSCVIGTFCAAASGYFALKVVLKTLSSRFFHRFGWYCLIIGIGVVGLVLGGVL
jgi:undecaprenyl-diphosphatase